MQTWSGQSTTATHSPTRRFTTTVLLVFSLAGLIAGFAFGGLTSSKSRATTTNLPPPKKSSPIVQVTTTVQPTATPENISLDAPIIKNYTYAEHADGTTSYTFSAQPIDKITKKPINVSDVTCRLWLTTDLDATNKALKANGFALLKNVSGLNQPFPQEVAITFTTPSGTGVQPCAANGPTNWTYTVPTTVTPNTYYLFILADWKGKHYNWFACQIKITA